MEDNQINSSGNQIQQQVELVTQEGQASWSSINLLSVDISQLMRQILQYCQVPSSLQAEDMSYISKALTNQRESKQFKFNDNLEMSISYSKKAVKLIEQLYNLRKEGNFLEYEILLAPFYYKQADSLVTYIEFNMDEMNNFKPLELPLDEESESEIVEQEEKQESNSKQIKENSQKNEDEDPEPIIEDVTQNEQNILKDQKSAVSSQTNEKNVQRCDFEELTDDIFQNLSLVMQIIGDFVSLKNIDQKSLENVDQEKLKQTRETILSSLMIDCTLREADFAKFYQDLNIARDDYQKVIDLCKKYPENNQKIMGSAYFALGSLQLEMNLREEALYNLTQASNLQKKVIIDAFKTRGTDEINKLNLDGVKEINYEEIPFMKLVQPSIFDDEQMKNDKKSLIEIQEYVKDCIDAAVINPQLEQMKKEAEEKKKQQGDDEAPKDFGIAPIDAEQFVKVDIKLKKKRNFEEANKEWENKDENKEQKEDANQIQSKPSLNHDKF